MRNNFILTTLVLGMIINGWAVIFLELPFYGETILILGLSILIMAVLHEKYVFLYAITVALSCGVFLIIYAFAHQQSAEVQILYMYSHLLLTSFLLLNWILMNFIKKLGYEINDLKHQLKLLEKYNGVTKILTLQEFSEQAKWLLKSSERNQEESWFVKICIDPPNKRTKVNLQETLEVLAVQTIRQRFDLITSNSGVLYLLLKNTDIDGAERMMERFREKCQAELNLLESPYHSEIEKMIDADHLNRLVGHKI